MDFELEDEHFIVVDSAQRVGSNIDQLVETPGSIVKKDNRLVRTRVNIHTVPASRILAGFISMIRTTDTRLREEYYLSSQSFISPDSGGKTYTEIKNACRELSQATVEVEETREDGKKSYSSWPFFLRVRYFNWNGTISVNFNPMLSEFLLSLNKCFTQYDLQEYLKLSSVYSQRTYELLASWRGTPEFVVRLSELYRYLGVTSSMMEYKNFRRRILLPVQEEITGLTNFQYVWEPVRAGRVVGSIRFIFKSKGDRSNVATTCDRPIHTVRALSAPTTSTTNIETTEKKTGASSKLFVRIRNIAQNTKTKEKD